MQPERPLNSPHIMTAEQLARRCELPEGKVRLPGVGQVGRYRYASAYEWLRPAAHRGSLEICFLARGSQTYRVNGRIYRLRGGDQYIVFPGEPHDSAGMPEEKGVLYWLTIKTKPPGGRLLYLDSASSSALLSALVHLPSRHFAAETGTKDILERIIAGIQARPRTRLTRLALASLVLDFLFSTVRASRDNRRAQPSAKIQRALDYIGEQHDGLPTVPQLARAVRLSPSRFKARFREEMGMPPREYVLRHRLDLARARLAVPGATVTAVAHDLGFSTSQYFATVFRRYYGATPSGQRRSSL